jgi:hypothetical protein
MDKGNQDETIILKLISGNCVLALEQLTAIHLVKKFPTLLNPKFHYSVKTNTAHYTKQLRTRPELHVLISETSILILSNHFNLNSNLVASPSGLQLKCSCTCFRHVCCMNHPLILLHLINMRWIKQVVKPPGRNFLWPFVISSLWSPVLFKLSCFIFGRNLNYLNIKLSSIYSLVLFVAGYAQKFRTMDSTRKSCLFWCGTQNTYKAATSQAKSYSCHVAWRNTTDTKRKHYCGIAGLSPIRLHGVLIKQTPRITSYWTFQNGASNSN